MTSPEIREAGLKLIRQGHKRIFLVSGQLPNADIEYLAEAISILYTVFDGVGEVHSVSVNVGALKAAEYAALLESYVGTVLIYQDTYHEASYRAAHVAGPKSDYHARLNAADVAFSAGVPDVGGGLMLGLGPWEYDLLGLVQHQAHLVRAYDTSYRTISLHRMLLDFVVTGGLPDVWTFAGGAVILAALLLFSLAGRTGRREKAA